MQPQVECFELKKFFFFWLVLWLVFFPKLNLFLTCIPYFPQCIKYFFICPCTNFGISKWKLYLHSIFAPVHSIVLLHWVDFTRVGIKIETWTNLAMILYLSKIYQKIFQSKTVSRIRLRFKINFTMKIQKRVFETLGLLLAIFWNQITRINCFNISNEKRIWCINVRLMHVNRPFWSFLLFFWFFISLLSFFVYLPFCLFNVHWWESIRLLGPGQRGETPVNIANNKIWGLMVFF